MMHAPSRAEEASEQQAASGHVGRLRPSLSLLPCCWGLVLEAGGLQQGVKQQQRQQQRRGVDKCALHHAELPGGTGAGLWEVLVAGVSAGPRLQRLLSANYEQTEGRQHLIRVFSYRVGPFRPYLRHPEPTAGLRWQHPSQGAS